MILTRLPAFNRFELARNHTLRPYPHVVETLGAVRAGEVENVGHTEATVTNARFRLTKLGLTPAVDRLYASENVGDGHPALDRARPLDELKFVRRLRRDERKPDPRVLLDICEGCGAVPSSTLYVGDSLSRDIGMANDAGVWSAWAEYGTHFDPDDWERLVRVTHWTPEDIERAEFAKREHRQAQPDVVLQEGLRDILEYFEFARTTHGES